MTTEDKQRVIGKVISINSDKFTVELLSGLDNFNLNGYDDIHYFAQLNSYVIIPYQNYFIVTEICGIRERDTSTPINNPTDQVLSKIQAGKFLDVIPIGTIKMISNENTFEFGVSVFPGLYSDVLYIKESELDIIYKTNKNKVQRCSEDGIKCNFQENCDYNCRYTSLSIGRSAIFNDYEVKIDIDRFFGSHSAILGNTGSGKSCTISALIQGIFDLKKNSAIGSTFLFFDVNGEYEQAFQKIQEINPEIEVKNYSLDTENKFILPHWFLTIEEWALLLKASERSQLPILRNALGFTQKISKEASDHIHACSIMYVFDNWESPVAKRQRIMSLITRAKFNPRIDTSKYNAKFGNFDPPQAEESFKDAIARFINPDLQIDPKYDFHPFEFKELETCLELAVLYEEYHGNRQIRDYCSTLFTRFKSIKERVDFNFLTKNSDEIEIDDYISNLIGIEKNTKKSQIIIINLNSANDEMVEVISCVLSRLIFEKLKIAKTRNVYPVNLILEEAHRYISIDSGKVFGDANQIFERIAKEGRKYGMFLTVSSQRPSELSRTVLSQCNNFIVHRIQNPEDLNHIKQITPHISESILKRLPSIPTQHALIFGQSVNLPTLFKVNDVDPKPKSDNNAISKNWFRETGFLPEFLDSEKSNEIKDLQVDNVKVESDI